MSLDNWKCTKHGFITQSKALFFEHMAMQDHYHEGIGGKCESCGKFLPTFKTKYINLTEPRIDLCDTCKNIPDIINIIRDKREGKFSLLPTRIGTL